MNRFVHTFTVLLSPKRFQSLVEPLIPLLWYICLISTFCGLIGALYLAPADYQQGDAFRIIYVHVPAAMMSLGIYLMIAVMAFLQLIWRIKLAELFIRASVSLGASFTFLALITGALWGKPMWGTYWIWDARLTSELVLLFLYLGLIGLGQAIRSKKKAAKAVSVMALIGAIDLPIIHYSVYWWHTLHQQGTLLRWGHPLIAPSMLWPLLAMIIAVVTYGAAIILMRMQSELLTAKRAV